MSFLCRRLFCRGFGVSCSSLLRASKMETNRGASFRFNCCCNLTLWVLKVERTDDEPASSGNAGPGVLSSGGSDGSNSSNTDNNNGSRGALEAMSGAARGVSQAATRAAARVTRPASRVTAGLMQGVAFSGRNTGENR